MTEITINTTDEGTRMAGYVSLEIVEHGDLLLETHIAPELLPDLDDPEDIREFAEVLKQSTEIAEAMDQ